MTTTTLIKNGYLLDPHLPFEQSDVLIENETIAQVAHAIDFPADMVINAQDKVIMPDSTNLPLTANLR